MNIIQSNITLSSSDDDDDSEDDMMKEMFGVSKITNMTINDDEEESGKWQESLSQAGLCRDSAAIGSLTLMVPPLFNP